MKILNAYKQASRQEVNVGKLGILFSKKTSVTDMSMAMRVLGIQRSMEQDCYLGLPLLFGRSKEKELRNIKERR